MMLAPRYPESTYSRHAQSKGVAPHNNYALSIDDININNTPV